MIRRTDQFKRALGEMHAYLIIHASEAVADRFSHAAEASILVIASNTATGRRVDTRSQALRDVRWRPVKGFPEHLLFYKVEGDDITFFHAIHGKRNVRLILRREPPEE